MGVCQRDIRHTAFFPTKKAGTIWAKKVVLNYNTTYKYP